MDRRPGTYVLVLRAFKARRVRIGSLGRSEVVPGYYLYVGSAFGPGGVAARVGRHQRQRKTLRWHIDYLSRVTQCEWVWYTHDPVRREHAWAKLLTRMPGLSIPLNGFGASDCLCESHLFFSRSRPALERWLRPGASGHSIRSWAP